MSLIYYACLFTICCRVSERVPLASSLDQGIFRDMNTPHEWIYEFSLEHFKAINNILSNKYGRYADSSPDLEEPPAYSCHIHHTHSICNNKV